MSTIGVRAADTPAGPVMFGHFNRFGEWTEIASATEGYFMERFAPGAFENTFAERTPKVLFQHGRDQLGKQPIGRATVVREDDEGAYYEVPLFPSVPGLLVDGLRSGAYGASFQFSVVREDLDQRPMRSARNPDGLPERTLREVKVFEFGPVTFPAYEGATAGLRHVAEELDYETRDDGRSPAAVLRMLNGTSMATPTSTLTVNVNGRQETLRPGISRLRVDHDIVRQQAYRFRPADPSDTATRSRLAKLTGTTTRAQRRGVLSSRSPFRLPAQPFQLPRRTTHGRVLP
jgi:HK97 family phage prohead protease